MSKSPRSLDSPVSKTPRSLDSPVSKTPMSLDSPVSKTPRSLDSPVSKTPRSLDSPMYKTPRSLDSPVSKTPRSLDSPVSRTKQTFKKNCHTNYLGRTNFWPRYFWSPHGVLDTGESISNLNNFMFCVSFCPLFKSSIMLYKFRFNSIIKKFFFTLLFNVLLPVQ